MMAEKDEEILELFLNESEISQDMIYQKLKKLSKTQEVIPLYCGSAKFGKGIEEILDGIIDFLPNAIRDTDNDLSALVFKLEYDKTLGKLAHIRLFAGKLKKQGYCL